MEAQIDYKALLYVYMAHVIDCESVSFLQYSGSNFELEGERKAALLDVEREVLAMMESGQPDLLQRYE